MYFTFIIIISLSHFIKKMQKVKIYYIFKDAKKKPEQATIKNEENIVLGVTTISFELIIFGWSCQGRNLRGRHEN